MNRFRLLLIHHETAVVQNDLNVTLAERMVPALRKLIQSEAERMAARYEMDDSPLALDAAAEELLDALRNLLMLSETDDQESCLHWRQLKKRYARWWLDLPAE